MPLYKTTMRNGVGYVKGNTPEEAAQQASRSMYSNARIVECYNSTSTAGEETIVYTFRGHNETFGVTVHLPPEL